MTRASWWDLSFGDIGWREAQLINGLSDDLQRVRAEVGDTEVYAGANTARIGKLFQLDVAQADEIERLRLTVRVLTETLIDTLGLDEKVLGYRMEAALADYDATRKEALSEGVQACCIRCAAEVPASSTVITRAGAVCDRCALSDV